jgi:hypothetical protein
MLQHSAEKPLEAVGRCPHGQTTKRAFVVLIDARNSAAHDQGIT